MSYGAGSSSAQVTFLTGYGTGNAANVTTITAADLTGAVPPVGCD
jgi:hypothetical protein